MLVLSQHDACSSQVPRRPEPPLSIIKALSPISTEKRCRLSPTC